MNVYIEFYIGMLLMPSFSGSLKLWPEL